MKRWSLHACFLDPACDEVGWDDDKRHRCWRIEIHTPFRHLGLALTRSSWYLGKPGGGNRPWSWS